MWFPGSSSSRSRRVIYVYVVVVVVHILVLHQQMAGAIRVFPGNAVANKVEFSHHRNVIVVHNKIISNKNQEEDLFKKYFGGRTFGPTTGNTATTAPQTAFDESKRRVPSCPDPLHN